MPAATTTTGSDFARSASDTLGGALEGLAKGAETQKNAGADAIAGIARSAKESADTLEQTSPQIARVVRTSADTVERLSNDIRSKDMGELLDATAAFARRQPFTFLGLGVLAGVVLSRAFTAR